jgi:hypothetical protein
MKDGTALLAKLAEHPATAARIACKLCVLFVGDDPPHSHLDAMDYLERGTPGSKSDAGGWLGRHLAASAPQDEHSSPFRAVGFGALLQASLRGGTAKAPTSLEAFRLQVRPPELPKVRAAHGQLYAGSGMLVGSGQQPLAALDLMEKLNPGQWPGLGAGQPLRPWRSAGHVRFSRCAGRDSLQAARQQCARRGVPRLYELRFSRDCAVERSQKSESLGERVTR